MIDIDVRIKNSEIFVLGITFKQNFPDARNTKVFDVAAALNEHRLSQMNDKQKTLICYYSQPSKVWDESPSARQGY